MRKNSVGGLLARLVNRPLLASPAIAKFYMGYMAQRDGVAGVLIDADDVRPFSDLTAVGKYDWSERKAFPTVPGKGIGVVQIDGALTHKLGAVAPFSGMTGYDGIERQIDAMQADPAIRGVVLDVHSHGGEVWGCFDLADKIHRLATTKPVWAIVDESAYSAAYCLASQANRIITPRTGGVGSVGVVIMHADYSQALDQDGIKITFIHAGAHKVDGNPFEPLPEAVRAELQEEVMASYRIFAAIVARGNGIPEADVVATEARCLNAEDALQVGFIDAIQSASETFEEFAAYVNGPRPSFSAAPAATANAKEDSMANTRAGAQAPTPHAEDCPPCECEDTMTGDEENDAEAFAKKNPAAAGVLRAAGAKAERARIAAVQELAEPGEEALTTKFIEEGADVGAAALGFAADRKQKRAAAAAARLTDTPSPVAETRSPSQSQPLQAAEVANMTDEQLKAAWDSSADLKAEFAASGDYIAYVRADAAGRVRVKSTR